ncbi:MAG: Fe-S protein assembly co-chaperone HscB [Myxococcales bacterium FL481]|nr:MAG: Fe-S protein assembly co-chaperone HscB [Myxococcales bacterium FL481]
MARRWISRRGCVAMDFGSIIPTSNSRAVAVTPSASDFALPQFDPNVDHFARLGLPRRIALARDDIETAYLERSRRVHPDRHASADAVVQRAALEHTAALNEAYAILRDRVRRLEYLVALAGIDLDSNDPNEGAPAPAQALLIEMIETREELAERIAQGPTAVDEMHDAVSDRADDRYEQAAVALEAGDVRRAAERLVEHRYLRRLLAEIEAATNH